VRAEFAAGSEGSEDTPFDSGPLKTRSLCMFRIGEADEQIGEWAMKVGMKGIKVDAALRMWPIARLELSEPT
jgi:hypothetical protein